MNFPQFWARGDCGSFSTWRWSSRSLEEARDLAQEAAQRLADAFRLGGFPSRHGGYYPNRPFREQILQEVKDEAGETCAVITRNSYGCLVLNTARVMFVDIDLPEPRPAAGLLKRLLGRSEPQAPTPEREAALDRIEEWTRTHPDWGWRVYQTRAGLRLLATQDLIKADSSSAGEVFEALGADPLYRKLCHQQDCFRARLTPKPWRCGIHRKPHRWPWLNERQENSFRKWDHEYQSHAAKWATCDLIRHVGNPHTHPVVQSIVNLHDAATRAASKLPLA